MELDINLLKEFARITNDSEQKTTNPYLRGTIVSNSDGKYVQLDGSTTITPISEIVDVKEGDRVLVSIENHKATIIGNFSFPPSARKEQEALDQAEAAQNTANTANSKAQEAGEKADTAINQSSIASVSAEEAKQQANDAIKSANTASTNASEAKTLATQASTDASEAKSQAALSQAASAEAQAEVTRLQGEVDDVKEDASKALEDLNAQADEITVIKETYATKVEVGNTKAELETTITTKVGELETTIGETYSTKTENVELEGRLQSQITQNADNISSQVSKIEKLESNTDQALKDVDDALAKANAAQTAAGQAQSTADAAQAAANAAQANADTATEKAQIAQNAADAAQAAADAADTAVQSAQADLNEAKQNLENVTNRVDATEEDIADAQAKVDKAQTDVNNALADAAEANAAATKAQEAADKAQQDAETAQGAANTAQQKADNAQTAADNAQAAADKAQEDVTALTKRVTTAETNISQNSENITLNANKTDEIGIKLDNLEIGGRNLYLQSRTLENGDSYWHGINGWTRSNELYEDLVVYTRSSTWSGFAPFIETKKGDIYTLSFYAKVEAGGSIYSVHRNIALGNVSTGLEIIGGNFSSGLLWVDKDEDGSEWKRYWATLKVTEDDVKLQWRVENQYEGFTLSVCGFKLERGNKATDWTPAPEDAESDIDGVKTDLTNNYYTKIETDAKVKVESDRITSTVSKVETVEKTANAAQDAINNLQVGGRNYISQGRGNKLSGYFENFDSIVDDDCAQYTFNVTDSGYFNMSLVPGFILGCRDYEVGKQIVYSYDIMFTKWDLDEGAEIGEWWMGQRYTNAVGDATEGAWRGVTQHGLPKVGVDCELNEWIHVSKVMTIPEQAAEGIGTNSNIQLQNKTAGTSMTITLCIKNVKIEYGNTETDWTPAPEDVNNSISDAQNAADDAQNAADAAQTTANNTQTTVTEVRSTVTQLSNMIANLITDENGGSLMTQTTDGWTFNMSTINGNLDAVQEALIEMEAEQSDTNNLLEKLSDLVDSVTKKTAYITMSTDDNGDPCIELGKADNLFKVRITNTAIDFLEGSAKIAYANNNTFYSTKIIVVELQIGKGPGFVWKTRENGNCGITYIES